MLLARFLLEGPFLGTVMECKNGILRVLLGHNQCGFLAQKIQ